MASDTIAEISESDACTTYPVIRRVWEGTTDTGTAVIIADSATYGRMLFLDGELQSTSSDEAIYHESLVHPAMTGRAHAAAGEPIRVLVVGGGEGATVREVLRWEHVLVDWVDYDRRLVVLCEEHLGWAPDIHGDRRVEYMCADIGALNEGMRDYDLVILDLPDPDGETGYLYSAAFWKQMRRLTSVRGGTIVSHVGPVRPACADADMGAGYQRVLRGLAEAGMDDWRTHFYATVIPSFQGAWGFCIMSRHGVPEESVLNPTVQLPLGLKAVDGAQLRSWAHPQLLWRVPRRDPKRYA